MKNLSESRRRRIDEAIDVLGATPDGRCSEYDLLRLLPELSRRQLRQAIGESWLQAYVETPPEDGLKP